MPVKSDKVLQMAHHCCGISSKEVVQPGRNYTDKELANSLHASAYYSKDNERLDFKYLPICVGPNNLVDAKQ